MARKSVKLALDEALRDVDTARQDGAAVALAKRYAAHIDADPAAIGRLGPLLVDVLRELGMTPRVRASVGKGGIEGDSGGKRAKLYALRDEHGARARTD